MPLNFVHGDITKLSTDAIVNAANESLLGGGGVDGAIHYAAGPELLAECETLGGCDPGEAKLTGAYRLPCRYVIHTVGPRWRGGGEGEEQTLRSCYRNALNLAKEKGCESIAFPLISAGTFGYPREAALVVATTEIRRFLKDADMAVTLVLHRPDPADTERRFPGLGSYLSGRREEDMVSCSMAADNLPPRPAAAPREKRRGLFPTGAARKESVISEEAAAPLAASNLEEALKTLDESFSQMLLRKITESGMTDAQCYKKANIDRKLFSKIRSDSLYRPSKPTALAFAFALELSPAETRELLRKAGFALSRSSKFDIIVEWFLDRRDYDLDRVNEALFAYDQSLLGSF